jgi:hypothetical protein
MAALPKYVVRFSFAVIGKNQRQKTSLKTKNNQKKSKKNIPAVKGSSTNNGIAL